MKEFIKEQTFQIHFVKLHLNFFVPWGKKSVMCSLLFSEKLSGISGKKNQPTTGVLCNSNLQYLGDKSARTVRTDKTPTLKSS